MLHRCIFLVWVKSKSELRQFVNKINNKHQSIKFDLKFSKESIEFLSTSLYIDSCNRLHTTIYKISNDCQNYLMLNRHTRSHSKKYHL